MLRRCFAPSQRATVLLGRSPCALRIPCVSKHTHRELCSKRTCSTDSSCSSSRGDGSSSGDSSGDSSSSSGNDSDDNATLLTHESKVQLGVLLGSGAMLQLGIGMIVPCLPAYAASVGLCDASVGVVIAVPAFARAILNLPAGRIADLIGRKRPWIVGSIIDGLGCLGTAAAAGLPSMVAARLVMGGGTAIAGSAAGAYSMDVVSQFPQHKGRILGAINTAMSLAWMTGPVLGGLLAERGGIGLPFVLVGGSLLALAPTVHFLLPETRPPLPGVTLSSLRLRPVLADTWTAFTTLMQDPTQRAVVLMQYVDLT
jgi:MFS family permease